MNRFSIIASALGDGVSLAGATPTFPRWLDETAVDGVRIGALHDRGRIYVSMDCGNERGSNDEAAGTDLEHLFSMTRGCPFLVIELLDGGDADPLIDVLTLLRKEAGLSRRDVIVSSRRLSTLHYLRCLDDEVRLGFIADIPLTVERYGTILDTNVHSIHLAREAVPASPLSKYRRAGLKTFVRNVDDPVEARVLRASGADGVFTRRPERLRSLHDLSDSVVREERH